MCSVTQLCLTLWTVAHQAPLSVGFFRQEYWSGWPFPPSGYLPDPVIESVSPALQADSLPAEPSGKPYIMHKMLLIKWLVKFDSYFIFNKHMLKYKTLRSLLEMRETFMSFKL